MSIPLLGEGRAKPGMPRPGAAPRWLLFAAGMLVGLLAYRLWELRPPRGAEATALAAFRDAFEITRTRYVDSAQTDPKKLSYDAITGMIQGLGDTGHSRFLTPQQVRAEQQSLSGTFVGIGVEMAERDGRPVVVTAFPGSPAARAGLRPGDRFLRVNGEDVSGLALSELSTRLRGPKGTEVRLTVLHPDNTVVEVTAQREEVRQPFVTWAPIQDSTLWHIHISQFGDGAADELDRALEAARAAGATGIVLDLRDDPGGFLKEAVAVVSRFVENGVVLIERDRSGRTEPVMVKSGVDAVTLPVTLLINGGSASAAEVTAAALLYYQRATAFGATTFGTGTVLQTFDLPGGSALLLGVREWLTPGGQPLRNRGVTPTETVTQPDGAATLVPPSPSSPPEQPCTATDAQLRAAIARLGLTCPTG